MPAAVQNLENNRDQSLDVFSPSQEVQQPAKAIQIHHSRVCCCVCCCKSGTTSLVCPPRTWIPRRWTNQPGCTANCERQPGLHHLNQAFGHKILQSSQDLREEGSIAMICVTRVLNPSDNLTEPPLAHCLHAGHCRRMMGHFN